MPGVFPLVHDISDEVQPAFQVSGRTSGFSHFLYICFFWFIAVSYGFLK